MEAKPVGSAPPGGNNETYAVAAAVAASSRERGEEGCGEGQGEHPASTVDAHSGGTGGSMDMDGGVPTASTEGCASRDEPSELVTGDVSKVTERVGGVEEGLGPAEVPGSRQYCARGVRRGVLLSEETVPWAVEATVGLIEDGEGEMPPRLLLPDRLSESACMSSWW